MAGSNRDESAVVRVLGELSLGGRRIAAGTTLGTVLAVLAAHLNERVWIDQLAEAVWPTGAPPSYRKAIQVAMFHLRDGLRLHSESADWLVSHPGAYALHCPTDAARFERGVRSGMQSLASGQFTAASDVLSEALAAWQEPLGGEECLAVAGWAARLQASRRSAETALLEVEVRLGTESLDALDRAVEREPFDERLWGLLMVALYRRGRQSDALATFQRARQTLVEAHGLEPGPFLRGVEQAVLLQSGELLAPAAGRATASRQWPPPPGQSRVVLRDRELDELHAVLAAERTATLVGPPGVGKTTIAATLARRWRDCAWVSVVGVPVTDAWGFDIAQRLGIVTERSLDTGSPTGIIAGVIADRPLLLVLDNAEHLAAEIGAMVDSLIRSCPNLSVLVTSRCELSSRSERVVRLRPFETAKEPNSDRSGESNELSVAARFLIERSALDARRVDPGPLNAIAKRVGGLAIGLEYAAVLLGRFTANELADNLEAIGLESHNLGLAECVAWALGSVSDDATTLARLLSELESPLDLARAQALGTAAGLEPRAVGAAWSELVAQSLIVEAELDNVTVRHILEPVRDHLRRSQPGSDSTLVDESCRVAVAALVGHELTEACRDLEGRSQKIGIDRVRQLMPDVRRCVLRAVEARDARTAARLLGLLRTWWWVSGTYADGQSLYRRSESLITEWTPDDQVDVTMRALALGAAVYTQPGFAAPARRVQQMTDLVEQMRSIGADADVAWLAQVAGAGYAFVGDETTARLYAHEALALARRSGHPWAIAWANYSLAISCGRSDPLASLEYMEQSIASFTLAGDLLSAARVRMFRGHGLRIFGVTDAADESLLGAKAACSALDAAPVTQLDCELGVAQNAHSAGRLEEAAERFRALIPRLAELGDDRCAAVAQRALAAILVERGDVDGGSVLVVRALEELRRLGSEDTEIASAHLVRAEIALRRGQTEFAARLIGKARCLASGPGVPVELREMARLDELETAVTDVIGRERCAELVTEGAHNASL